MAVGDYIAANTCGTRIALLFAFVKKYPTVKN